ncbi:MAG: hypothetical protein LBS18_04445 [Clostridiales bacterium]|jgi:hypothetical protein|nr:hypothetical protein [Clostridiales bacterium]
MACFLVPAAEAIAVTVATQIAKSKEKEPQPLKPETGSGDCGMENKIPFSGKIKWLTNLLWGGSALLAFEHVWHGEVTPWFPFLTAAGNPSDALAMLREMSTAGVAMALLVTAFWAGMLIVSGVMEKRALKTRAAAKQEG